MDEKDRTTPADDVARPDLEPAGSPHAADDADAAVARLRAADPAARREPDVAALRAAVDARTGDRVAAAEGETADGVVGAAPGATDELAARRARRWTSWPARVAGVAAAALLVGGGGGYAIGAAAAPEPAADAITVGTPGAAGQAGPAMAPESLAADGSRLAATDMAWGGWGGWGRTVFTSSGLSTEGGSAPAWGFDPAAVVTQEVAQAAAAALGVEGTAEPADGGWVVGPRDGSGATVSVYPDGAASFSYYDPAKDSWSCATVMPVEPEVREPGAEGDAATSDTGVVEGMVEPQDCAQRDLGPAPTGDAAAAVVRDALSALGLDPASFELVVEEPGDPSWGFVTAHQVVDGRRTGLVWSASLTGAGIQGLNGSLAPLVPLGDYPVVSPAEAVERLTDPRFGGGGGPVRWLEGAEGGDAAVSSPTPEVPPTPTAGGPIAWPVTTVTIVDAQLGAALHTLPNGAAALLPTYELTGDDGGVWTVLAVAEDALDLAADR